MRNTLAIVGSHPRAKETFNFDRTDCDIWVFNEALTAQDWMKRADAVFQMHLEPIWRNPNNRNDPRHAQWLMSGNTPTVYMQEQYADVPKSVRYPLDEIKAQLLPGFEWQSQTAQGRHYFSSTFCYALALAVYQGYKTLEIHGAEMETDTEYRYQRDGVTFWLGLALGRGVNIKAYTKMFDFPLYGYEGEAELQEDEFARRIEELKPQLEAAKQTYKETAAIADKAIKDFLETGKNPDLVVTSLKQQVTAAYQMNIIAGQIQENEKYQAKAEAMKATAGDFKFSRQEFEAAMQGVGMEHDSYVNKATAAAGACEALFQTAKRATNYAKRKRAITEFIPAARQYMTASAHVGLYNGAAQENRAFLNKLDKLIKAAGGAKSEAVLLAQ